jgi:hypothetical protein
MHLTWSTSSSSDEECVEEAPAGVAEAGSCEVLKPQDRSRHSIEPRRRRHEHVAGRPVRRRRTAAPPAVRAVIGAACALIAYGVRDLAVLLAAHARQDGEPRRLSLVRGRAAGAMLRALRESTMDFPASDRRRVDLAKRRGVAMTVLALLAAATFALAPDWARRIGRDVAARDLATAPPLDITWLAGLLDSLGTWWEGQPTGSKIAIAVGIAALVALSGGSLGLAFGVSGVGTYLLAHGHGTADLIRDPRAATRSYLTTTTPTGIVADGAEALLTFGPWSFAGATAGRSIRLAAEEYARDPVLFAARRRAAAGGDRGSIRISRDDDLPFGSLEPGKLADHEVRQAADIVQYRGGHFIGVPKRDAPGIDGHLDGVPVSLKETSSQSPMAILSYASDAEHQAREAGYQGVDLYISAERQSRARLLDFASKGPLARIPSQGVLRIIHVKTGDGWLTIPGDLP